MSKNGPVADYRLPFVVRTRRRFHQTFCFDPHAKSSRQSLFRRGCHSAAMSGRASTNGRLRKSLVSLNAQ